MKKTLAFIGAAAAALTFAGAAHADNGGGYVGLSYANGSESDVRSWNIDGAAEIGSNIQIDGSYDNVHDSNADLYAVGGHFFSRGDRWLWGGYVGYDRLNGGGDDVNEWTVAAQTQYYADKTILSGNLSYSRTDSSFADSNTYQLTGDARFFATDNLSFNLDAGYGRLDADLGNENFLTFGGGIEWKPDSLPISVYGNVAVFDPHESSSDNETTWTVGVRYNWGGSLYDRDRNGAGLSSPHGPLAQLL